MENPFNLPEEKLKELLKSYKDWLNNDHNEARYPQELREKAEEIRKDFLDGKVLNSTSDDEFYEKIYKYSRSLEGPVQIKLGEQRLRENITDLRRNLDYIISLEDTPFVIAQNIFEEKYRIENFSKAFWSPILNAKFPDELPNWNNKTEKFMKKLGVNITTSRLSISQKYELLSNAFKYLASISEGLDFFDINHLMHYGTVINEGVDLLNNMLGINKDPILNLIDEYKVLIRETKLQHELYKWELVKKYFGQPDISADNFTEEIKNLDFKNLVFYNANVVKNNIASNMPEEYRECFRKLFDESISLEERITQFMDDVLQIYRKLESTLGHHHDERTISAFLTYKKPDKYTFYKDSYYKKYCDFIGIKPKSVGEKYAHYMQLVSDFRERYIIQDKELLNLVNSFMTTDCYDDENHLLLAQDIFFQTLDKAEEEVIEIGKEKIYKISMGEFSLDDLNEYMSRKVVLVNGRTRAKAVSSITQGEIFQNKINDGDYFYLTHGNKGVKLLGIFSGDAQPVINPDMAEDGWLERSFIEISMPRKKQPYKSRHKWWTPRDNSTCVEIPRNEIAEANDLLFKPYFNTVFKVKDTEGPGVEEPSPGTEKKTEISSLNMILYGPPGTGKTYCLVDKVVECIEPERFKHGNHEHNKRIYKELEKDGRVIFTTFHQSMSYEDFVEGIKPVTDDDNNLSYKIIDGVFKRLSINAAFEYISENAQAATASLDFSALYDKLLDEVNNSFDAEEKVNLELKSGAEIEIIEVTAGENFHLKHKNGIRTYTVSRRRLEKLYTELPELDEIDNINAAFREVIGGSNSSAYWAVLNKLASYKDQTTALREAKQFGYEEKVDAVKKLKSEDFLKKKVRKYALVIDEINRGNVSQVFGELITLIEEDKRYGGNESVCTVLPYSRDRFFIPSNLYIIGTMNTADRSVEALDTALRRRFSFEEKMPEYDLPELSKEIAGFNLSDILRTINKRIEKLIDRDHQIGHSYFIGVNTDEDLMQVFRDKVIPLLQEYFFGNYEKIGLVLGDGFVKKMKDDGKIFSGFAVEDTEVYDKPVFHFIDKSKSDLISFRNAISILMSRNNSQDN